MSARAWQVGGVPVDEIAARHGTPFYVYDADVLRETLGTVRDAFDPSLRILFSLKANPNLAVCATLARGGAGAEVSSLAELTTALRAGVDRDEIIFLGPGKSVEEIGACLDAGIHLIVCESLTELAVIDQLALERGTRAPVALRVNPNFTVKGSGLTMGGKPRQFGIDEDVLLADADLASRHPNLRLVGFHVYMGTRVLSPTVIVDNTRQVLELADRLGAALGIEPQFVDIGGGLGVAYFADEADLDLPAVAAGVNPLIAAYSAAHPHIRLVMELGRYLVARAGTYVTRVRYTKSSHGVNFAVADGGTNHHMAAVGIGSFVRRNFPIRLLSRRTDESRQIWTITGPLCTPNDVLGTSVSLPALAPGDLIGVDRSGAYGPSASPINFLSHGAPAEVLVDGGVDHLVRARDRVEDILRGQLLVPRPTGDGSTAAAIITRSTS